MLQVLKAGAYEHLNVLDIPFSIYVLNLKMSYSKLWIFKVIQIFLNTEYVMHLAKNHWYFAFTQDTGDRQCLCASVVRTGMITTNDEHHDVAAIMMSIFKCMLDSAVGTHVTMIGVLHAFKNTFLTSILPYNLQPHPCKMWRISLECTATVCQEQQLKLLWYFINIFTIWQASPCNMFLVLIYFALIVIQCILLMQLCIN